MTLRLEVLLKENKITRVEYETYLLFALDDIGKRYFNRMWKSCLMEEPLELKNETAMWHDGRRSVWRHIQVLIDNVEHQLELSNE